MWGEATLFYVHRNTRRGTAVGLSVLRDTPHARVSVSYVLEASLLLNDRFQTGSPVGTLEANRTRASLDVKYSTGVNGYFANSFFPA